MRLEQDGPIDPERAQLRRRGCRPVRGELGGDPTKDRGELEAMAGAQRDDDAGLVGQAVDDEVTIRRQRVQARLGVDRRAQRTREMALQEPGDATERGLVTLERAAIRVDRLAAAVLGRLWPGLAVRREAVDTTGRPSRSRPGTDPARMQPGPGRRNR